MICEAKTEPESPVVNPLAYIVYCTTEGPDQGPRYCYKEEIFKTAVPGAWEKAVRRMKSLCDAGKLAWIESAYKLPYVLERNSYMELPKPEKETTKTS